MDKLKVFNIGPICCPEGDRKGYGGDECRANLLSTGRIMCIACAQVHDGTPASKDRAAKYLVQRVCDILSLGGSPRVQRGAQSSLSRQVSPDSDGNIPRISPYDASCLSGYDPNQSDMVRVSINCGPVKAEMSYSEAELFNGLQPDIDYNCALSASEIALLPPFLPGMIVKLEELGFCVRGDESTRQEYLTRYLRSLSLTCGTKVGTMGYVSGISLALSWMVS